MLRLDRPKTKLIKQSILLLMIIAGVMICGAWLFTESSYVHHSGYFIEQPIAFSHELHTKEVGLDCTFCHTQANHQAKAGMPSMETCYGCHRDILNKSDFLKPVRDSYENKKPLEWNRVNRLPDHVFFYHKSHVAAGVSCTECHGDAHGKPLMDKQQNFTMQFCLNCHRQENDQRLQDCYTCHR